MLLTALAYLLIAALARDRAADADMAEARRILGKDFPA